MWLTASAVSYSAARLARRVRSHSVVGRGGRERIWLPMSGETVRTTAGEGLGHGSMMKLDALGEFVAAIGPSVRPAV